MDVPDQHALDVFEVVAGRGQAVDERRSLLFGVPDRVHQDDPARHLE